MIDNNDFSKRRFLFEDAIFRTFRPNKKKEIKGISSVRTRKRETPARFLKTVLSARDSGNPGLSSFYFFSSPPPLYPRVRASATRDAPVELVRKLIAPPPRFNSIIQAASCRCKFHPLTFFTPSPKRSPDPLPGTGRILNPS